MVWNQCNKKTVEKNNKAHEKVEDTLEDLESERKKNHFR